MHSRCRLHLESQCPCQPLRFRPSFCTPRGESASKCCASSAALAISATGLGRLCLGTWDHRTTQNTSTRTRTAASDSDKWRCDGNQKRGPSPHPCVQEEPLRLEPFRLEPLRPLRPLQLPPPAHKSGDVNAGEVAKSTLQSNDRMALWNAPWMWVLYIDPM